MSNETDRRDVAGLEDVIRAATRLATPLRDAVAAAGSVAEREAAMLATVAEDVRDRVIAAERLKAVRGDELLEGFRRSAHRGVDLAFDVAGTFMTAAGDAVDAFAKAPRNAAIKASPAQ